MTDTAPTALALRNLADDIEREAREEWDRVLIRREGLEGRSAGSSYWDGRQAALRGVVARLRKLSDDLTPSHAPRTSKRGRPGGSAGGA